MKAVTAISLILAALSTADVAQAQTTADEAYVMSREAYVAGDFAAALRLLRRAHRLEPKALFVYNIGAVQERMGELSAAYGTFLKAQAFPGVTPKVAELARFKAGEIKPLLDKAVVQLNGLRDDVALQVDRKRITDRSKDLVLPAGPHVMCWYGPGSGRAVCLLRSLDRGRRAPLAPSPALADLPSLSWEPGLESLAVYGMPLTTDLAKLTRLRLEAGTHTISYRYRGEAKQSRTITLEAGETLELARIPSAPPVVIKSEPPSSGYIHWSVVGPGIAAAATGAALLAVGGADRAAALESDDAGLAHTLSQRDAFEQLDSADGKLLIGGVLTGLGVAAIIGGVVWWASSDDSPAPSVRLGPGAGLSIGGEF